MTVPSSLEGGQLTGQLGKQRFIGSADRPFRERHQQHGMPFLRKPPGGIMPGRMPLAAAHISCCIWLSI